MVTTKSLPQLRRFWDKQSKTYDKTMAWSERRFFNDTREWVAGQAHGEVLEVAIGTGLNLRWYPDDATVTGVELSPAMLDIARERVESSSRAVDLRLGDAQDLGFADATFDAVVCTFSLCAIPDDRTAVSEMVRVLRPGGTLLLADHVVSTSWWIRGIQRLIEVVSIRVGGEHFRRRPIRHVEAAGLVVERHDRFKRGLIERLRARKPQ